MASLRFLGSVRALNRPHGGSFIRFLRQTTPEMSLSSPLKLASSFPHLADIGRPRYQSSSSLPTIAQPSFWSSLVPKFMRAGPAKPSKETSKEWNPYTFFIIIFLFIGSQAIQLIALRRGFDHFSRETEAKLGLLREIVRRVQAGENVDVEAMLGTGDEQRERDWEEVMRELEAEDAIIQVRRKKKRSKLAGNPPMENGQSTGSDG